MAQPNTLINGDVEHGGFGGVTAQATQLNDELALLVGGGGGWLINHTVAVGMAGYGLTTSVPVADPSFTRPQYLEMGYGGLYLGYIHNSDELVHVTANALVGAGAVSLTDAPPSDNWGRNDSRGPSDAFFVVEPGISAELNVTSYFRVALGGSYRFVTGIEDVPGVANSTISGPAGSVMFKFGSF